MAIVKAVDSAQLNADLTSVANAIRTKGGTAASLAFPADFVTAIGAIPSGGGGWTTNGIADRSEPSGAITISGVSSIANYAFESCDGITSIYSADATHIGTRVFCNISGLKLVKFPSVISCDGSAYCFQYSGSKGNDGTIYVFPKLQASGNRMFERCNAHAIDIGPDYSEIYTDNFYNNTETIRIERLILRRSSGIVILGAANSVRGVEKVYCPQSLISTYQTATNWSTRYSAGRITFVAIEGSEYDGYWADGTPIT